MKVRSVWALCAMCMWASVVTGAIGQNFPTRPVRIITSPIGGGNDFTARLIAQGISGSLGQPVIVENRNSNVIAVLVSKAPADGHTILFHGSGMWNQWLMKKTEYDPIKDFAPIVTVAQSPNILLVTPSSGIKSVKELIAIAKAKPGTLNYSFGAFASAAQLAAELFKHMAGVNITGVAYAGTGAQINAILSGEVQLSFAQAPIASQYMKSGRVIALGVTTLSPTALAPGLPTIASLGLPGFEATSIDVMLAPVGSPQAAVRRLNQDIVTFLSQSDIKEKFIAMGSEVIASTPEGLSATMNTEIKRMSKVVKDAHLRVE